MTKLLSDLYNVTLKRGIRGKASEGFIRPTIGENFMTHRDFEGIVKQMVIFNSGPNVSTNKTSVSVPNGKSISTTISFSDGYELDSVSHGSVIGNTWTINNVTSDISATITAKLSIIDLSLAPNFTRSTNFIGYEGQDIIKVNNSLGVAPMDQPGTYSFDGSTTGNCEGTIGAGWYCPSKVQLQTLYTNKAGINSVADVDFASAWYRSSYRHSSTSAYMLHFGNGDDGNWYTYYARNVRCVRSL